MGNPVKENRLGRFYIPKRLYESEDRDAVIFREKIMKNILPVHVKERMETYEFEAYCKYFDQLTPRDGIPNYKILFQPPGELNITREPEEILSHFSVGDE